MTHLTRRLVLAAAVLLLSSCATAPSPDGADARPPIVFVHGNGDSAAVWLTTMWRFESNGWPRERLHAIDMPLPTARDDDTREQPGRSSAAEHRDYLRAEVDKVLARTGARQVVLMGNSRGGNAIRNYIAHGGGDKTVSHAILGGTPNHGVWAVPIEGLSDRSEFAGHGPFLSALNAPKNAAGDEVTGPVRWMTVRSDGNDKFAQPDGLWIGKRGVATGVTAAGPQLKGATNVVIPRIDHRETSFSPAAFEAAHRFITGVAPARSAIAPEPRVSLSGKVSGAGTNIGLAGARIEVFTVDPRTGERLGPALYTAVVPAAGEWGPLVTDPQARHEFVVSAPGYATTHFYRSPFPRSTQVLHVRPERVPEADRAAPALAVMTRPRGYLDPGRDTMAFDGQSPPPGALPGAGVAVSRTKPAGPPRPLVAEFNGERVVGRSWPLADNHVTVLELNH
ncbi:alpha/beta fold hydrolase [Pseudorhodoferax sp. Leaf267]|uniref:alpha/beta fold hydrolase n=1 Tax=Pseudorhodoferax sp. Leaf267 TaxID=1736316 RepID=UPI0006FF5936|nr:alpha/beta fold hydrolase [Pseudorhodoferax sp. Leaf267]KQP14182.1 twin-arginine translocation pathway signal [Pseudorhodoferax sp. Leaf267]